LVQNSCLNMSVFYTRYDGMTVSKMNILIVSKLSLSHWLGSHFQLTSHLKLNKLPLLR